MRTLKWHSSTLTIDLPKSCQNIGMFLISPTIRFLRLGSGILERSIWQKPNPNPGFHKIAVKILLEMSQTDTVARQRDEARLLGMLNHITSLR